MKAGGCGDVVSCVKLDVGSRYCREVRFCGGVIVWVVVLWGRGFVEVVISAFLNILNG